MVRGEADINQTLRLVIKAKDGDDAALNFLLQRYLQRILRIVRVRLGPQLRTKMDSMDVVQEVMIRAIKGFEHFEAEDESAFLRWISKLVQNQINDLAAYYHAGKRDVNLEIQKKRTDSKNHRSVIANFAANSRCGPVAQIRLKEDVLQLEAALDLLPEKQREIVVMRLYEEFSFKEIGAVVSLSEDATRMQFARAMNKLSDAMGAE